MWCEFAKKKVARSQIQNGRSREISQSHTTKRHMEAAVSASPSGLALLRPSALSVRGVVASSRVRPWCPLCPSVLSVLSVRPLRPSCLRFLLAACYLLPLCVRASVCASVRPCVRASVCSSSFSPSVSVLLLASAKNGGFCCLSDRTRPRVPLPLASPLLNGGGVHAGGPKFS